MVMNRDEGSEFHRYLTLNGRHFLLLIADLNLKPGLLEIAMEDPGSDLLETTNLSEEFATSVCVCDKRSERQQSRAVH